MVGVWLRGSLARAGTETEVEVISTEDGCANEARRMQRELCRSETGPELTFPDVSSYTPPLISFSPSQYTLSWMTPREWERSSTVDLLSTEDKEEVTEMVCRGCLSLFLFLFLLLFLTLMRMMMTMNWWEENREQEDDCAGLGKHPLYVD